MITHNQDVFSGFDLNCILKVEGKIISTFDSVIDIEKEDYKGLDREYVVGEDNINIDIEFRIFTLQLENIVEWLEDGDFVERLQRCFYKINDWLEEDRIYHYNLMKSDIFDEDYEKPKPKEPEIDFTYIDSENNIEFSLDLEGMFNRGYLGLLISYIKQYQLYKDEIFTVDLENKGFKKSILVYLSDVRRELKLEDNEGNDDSELWLCFRGDKVEVK